LIGMLCRDLLWNCKGMPKFWDMTEHEEPLKKTDPHVKKMSSQICKTQQFIITIIWEHIPCFLYMCHTRAIFIVHPTHHRRLFKIPWFFPTRA
jgi:hypothetical protein